MKTYFGLIALALLLVTAVAGHCQWNYMGVFNDATTARSAGMGATGIAVADDLSAADFNPASLPWMNLAPAVEGDSPVNWGVAGTWGGGSFDDLSLKLGVVDKQARWGAAVSVERASFGPEDNDIWSFSYGGAFTNSPTSWGVSLDQERWMGESYTWVNVGFLHSIPVENAKPVKVGLLITNVAQAYDDKFFVNLGMAAPLGDQLTLAVDAWDLGDWYGTVICAGLEWQVDPNWAFRVGKWGSPAYGYDPSYTCGAGYKGAGWSLDAALVGFSGDDSEFLVTANWNFN